MKSMNDLMLNYLQDIYYAEKQSVRGMAKMAKAVDADEIKQAILEHRDQTQGQIERLERVFEMIGKRPRGKKCAAMDGLAQEADETAQEGEKGPVLDAAMIANAQAIEHYEIARYGAMVAWARQIGMNEAVELLQQTLQEEKDSDARLNEIAERAANREAAESGAEDEESAQEEGGEQPRGRGRRAPKSSGDEQGGEQGGGEEARPRGGRRASAASSSAPRGKSSAAEKPARRSSSRSKPAGEAPKRRSTRSK